MRNPELVFQPPMTKLWIEPSNELILEAHIRCAAFEMPFSPSDSRFFGEAGWTIAQRVCFSDKAGYYQVQDTESPALSVPIRGARQDTYQYIDVMIGQLLEEVEIERVYFEAYEGAAFIMTCVLCISHVPRCNTILVHAISQISIHAKYGVCAH